MFPATKGVPLLDIAGRAAVPSWAGSLERFLAEFVHGRGLGILHPNLDGRVSFARRLPPSNGAVVEAVASGDSGEASGVVQLEPTDSPTLRGADDGRKGRETLVRTMKDVMKALVRTPKYVDILIYDTIAAKPCASSQNFIYLVRSITSMDTFSIRDRVSYEFKIKCRLVLVGTHR